MDALAEALERVADRERTLEVYTADADVAAALADRFSARTVTVDRASIPPVAGEGFVVVRDAGGEFQAALGVDRLRAILSPSVDPPWSRTASSAPFDFLEGLVFSAADRRQLLAAAREIEERAWRVGSGTVYTGFQRWEAFRDQAPVYERLAAETDLRLTLFVEDGTDAASAAVPVVTADAEEIGRYWFVVFDGGDDPTNACGLLAAERSPGAYEGMWTYERELVAELCAYLERSYLE